MAPQGTSLYTVLAAAVAAARYDNPLHKELTYHYVYDEGALFMLTRDKMAQVIGLGSPGLNIFKHFPAVTAAKGALQKELAAQGGGMTSEPRSDALVATASISTQAGLGCDPDKPSLGGFTCYLNGILEARMLTNEETITYEFRGTMRWFDIWDFDSMRPARPGEEAQAHPETRTKSGEEATRMGAAFLPGVAFNIESEDAPIRQKDTDPAPEW